MTQQGQGQSQSQSGGFVPIIIILVAIIIWIAIVIIDDVLLTRLENNIRKHQNEIAVMLEFFTTTLKSIQTQS